MTLRLLRLLHLKYVALPLQPHRQISKLLVLVQLAFAADLSVSPQPVQAGKPIGYAAFRS